MGLIAYAWKVIVVQNANVRISIFSAGLQEMIEKLAELPQGSPDKE